jgi:hypothetical protein
MDHSKAIRGDTMYEIRPVPVWEHEVLAEMDDYRNYLAGEFRRSQRQRRPGATQSRKPVVRRTVRR